MSYSHNPFINNSSNLIGGSLVVHWSTIGGPLVLPVICSGSNNALTARYQRGDGDSEILNFKF